MEGGDRILQGRVNFAYYYRVSKDWNPETYTQQLKYILKYSVGPGKIKGHLNISWSHYTILRNVLQQYNVA